MTDAQFPIKVMEPVGVEALPLGDNGRGRTMAGIYSVRPTRLGHVSTPLLWEEVINGVNPDDFHLRSFHKRLKSVGDLSKVMNQKNDFSLILHYFT